MKCEMGWATCLWEVGRGLLTSYFTLLLRHLEHSVKIGIVPAGLSANDYADLVTGFQPGQYNLRNLPSNAWPCDSSRESHLPSANPLHRPRFPLSHR